tara:strand:+ start:176 stop:640 length:465 start_codon:yes stop_codon:yes gene_type:complete
MRKYVLDTSVFLNQIHPDGVLFTIQEVVDEIHNSTSKNYFLNLVQIGLSVDSPTLDSISDVKKMAEYTGDIGKLSETDIKLIALAKTKSATIVSSDFAIQNVSLALELKWISPDRKGIKSLLIWKWRCEACFHIFEKPLKECKICGSSLRAIRK